MTRPSGGSSIGIGLQGLAIRDTTAGVFPLHSPVFIFYLFFFSVCEGAGDWRKRQALTARLILGKHRIRIIRIFGDTGSYFHFSLENDRHIRFYLYKEPSHC